MDYNALYKKIETNVTDLFEKQKTEGLYYHSLEHTQQVVARTKEIAAHYNVNEKEMLILYAAAWFHDTGYLFNDADTHEEKSIEVMRAYLTKLIDDEEVILAVEECIMATKPPQRPKNLLEEIICDADTYHLGTKAFKESNKRIRKERLEKKGMMVNKTEWMKGAIGFLESHKFHTSYCRELLDKKKKENIEMLQERLEKRQDRIGDMVEINGPVIKPKSALMTKGIQTMLRLTSDNHLELSGMADGKANILISVNAIIISVILSVLVRRLEVDTHLTIPTILFLVMSVTTIVIAILATRPKISEGVFSDQDIMNKKTNLLFFGNFHRAPQDQYENAMRTMMGDSDYLYGSLIKDIYALGVVLARKYRLIRIAYNIFMIGIVVSVLSFAIAVYLNHVDSEPTTPAGNTATMPL
jgi:predicted metal-dependent HD superfamily phosphohydrolase